jgi:uncharacterized protein YhbP (UPF0306 family)
MKSQHSQQIIRNPRAAAAVYPECEGWRGIKGLQLRGEVHFVDNAEAWDSAWELYREKFPFVRSLKFIIVKNQLYFFEPSWVRLVDNSMGFGFKKEWQLQ